MHKIRTFGFILLAVFSVVFSVSAKNGDTPKVPETDVKQQRLVEGVDIQGNRRLRDEDLLYYVKTRPGDVYNPQQLERDLKELISLNFFDKAETKVLTEDGPRGGVNVIFQVKELPIIRDLQFKGAKAIQESDILKEFREKRVGISKEAIYNPVNLQKAKRTIREMLASKGFPNAIVTESVEEVSATSIAITFDVDQGNRSRIIEIHFEGLEHFKESELRGALELVKQTGLITRFKGADILDSRKLQYDLQKNVGEYMRSKGYFQARVGEPKVEGLGYKRTGIFPSLSLPVISTKDDTLKITVPISEGKLFRVGDVTIEGNSIFSAELIKNALGLQKGEIADGKRLRTALYEDLKKEYGSAGFVQYDAELDPDYKENPANPKEGIVDFKIVIDEGKQFRLRRLEFTGNTFTRDRVLRREVIVNEGDIYSQRNLEYSVVRLNQTGYFDPIDKDKDVEIRTDEESGDVDLVLKVKEKGRQQIQFNGGVSGVGGSFFGLEYSTNNLLGRGETVAFNVGFGNRQRSFQLSFQEPYFRDRPITVGFSLFTSSYKFFGEGTSFVQDTNTINNFINSSYGNTTADQNNLFTQSTYGASVFATTQLSELFFKKRRWSNFSRIGLTYQYSATTIKDPPVNSSGDPTKVIPIVFAQPNIITSRATGSFVYDTREPAANGIDTLKGSNLSLSFAISGLGGDVRTYQPTLSYSKFIPVRRTRSRNAEVFAFRILAGTIGTFGVSDKIRNANSLSFIDGIPYYERYFLGSENDIRGYENRSIGPIARLDGFVTTQNVVLATNLTGTPVEVTGLTDAQKAAITQLGTFTGASGTNLLQTTANYQYIGGDTQLLGNFEYRVPIFGPVTMAGFADIGTAFNLKRGGTQSINSTFLRDDLFLGSTTINSLVVSKNNNLAYNFLTGSLLLRNGQLLTSTQYLADYCGTDTNGDGVVDGNDCPSTFPAEVSEVFLRGNAQTNTKINIGDSAFSKIGNFRASVGLELRVQVPIVNVPFRLIYFYNPNIKIGVTDEAPGLFLPGKRAGLRFTVGRTF